MNKRLRLAAALALTSTVFACRQTDLPTELIGTWATTVQSHADRRFRITNDSHRIISVTRYGWAGQGTIRIDYERNGLENTLRIELDPDSATVRLTNKREMVWRRQNTSVP